MCQFLSFGEAVPMLGEGITSSGNGVVGNTPGFPETS